MTVVVNTSPLILLGKIEKLDLLAQLYKSVVIPASVLAELKAKPGSEVQLSSDFARIWRMRIMKRSGIIIPAS